MNDFNYDNEIIEISNDAEEMIKEREEVIVTKENKKKNKKNLRDKWNDLSKKQKTIIIISIVLVLVVIIGIILYFVVFKKDEEVKNNEEPVIIEKDNYRYENGKLIFLDKNEKEIGSYDCKVKDVEKCYVAKINYTNDSFDRIKTVDENGNEIEKNSQIYLDNYVFVYDDEKISLYDISKKETDLELNSIKTYNTENNLIVVEDEINKYGLIEITEEGYEYLIRCSYDNLGIVNTELEYLVAQDKDEYYVIDKEGKTLSENINSEIRSVNKDYIVTNTKNTYSLYNYQYEELISDYDYIGLHDEVISLVKSNRLYLVNNNLSKLYEDGIRLENSDYVKQYIYNDNKLVDTKKSYEIKVDGNIATITIGKDIKEINMAEGEVSSTLTYVNYFDGKLYFYSDEEKEDLLGTYTCINENNITNGDDTLSNCRLYSNDLGTSGIYNNEYVFIYDNENDKEVKYYLYNIKEKKNKGTYTSIEIINEEELNNNIEQNYTSSSFIIAKAATGNNKGNFGVLEINSDKVAGKVEFKYESIKRENNYYLLINVDKSYSIYNESFTKISNEFSYIKIYEDYYVGINNDKLNVYTFNNTLGILKKDLKVTNNKYTIDFTDGIIIEIDGITYKYDKSGNEVEDEPLLNNEINSEEGAE